MLTLLHFSDIHFHKTHGGEQFDLDGQLRKIILEDVKSKRVTTNYDGLLVSGDVAYSGKKDEYDLAEAWLKTIEDETGIEPAHTYMVPGNHDVDRDIAPKDGFLCNSHEALRNCATLQERADKLQILLTKEKILSPLAALKEYNDFAQKYGCRSRNQFLPVDDKNNPPRLAWVEVFPKMLDDGTPLRIHGLNSALISDHTDLIGRLYVSPFQTQHFPCDSSAVDLLMCHHPPSWLLDKSPVEANILKYSQIALFGHEHSHRAHKIESTVHLFAGATHPPRRDPDWIPTYHILQIEIREDAGKRTLVTRIHTRVLHGLEFVPLPKKDGSLVREYLLSLPDKVETPKSSSKTAPSNTAGETDMTTPTTENSTPFHLALRELIIHFHRLSTPVRLNMATKLGLIRDGDDLSPQVLWDIVIQRGRDENRLADLWNAIAALDTAIAAKANPFK